jgi:mannose-6-phosphate isomerase-like protein (cupin superfamily)
MTAQVIPLNLKEEFHTPEDCYILESWNHKKYDKKVSIARARVEPGVTTRLHRLKGVVERYIIIKGTGIVSAGEISAQKVEPGDIVFIPSDSPQQITNIGTDDLIFYCICTPPFSPECYEDIQK